MCDADKDGNRDFSWIHRYPMRGAGFTLDSTGFNGLNPGCCCGPTVSLREGQRLEDTPLPTKEEGSGVLWNRVSSRLRNPCGFRTIHFVLPAIGGLRSSGKPYRQNALGSRPMTVVAIFRVCRHPDGEKALR
jgi:hypothetical protein